MKYIVFSDFDGTISDHNTLVEVLRKFTVGADPEMERKMLRHEATLSEGVRYFMERIPSSAYPDIVEYSRNIRPRPGFRELLILLEKKRIPFVVLSGGLAVMTREALRTYLPMIAGVRAVEVETAGEFLKVITPYDDGCELVAKRRVAAEYGFEKMICIGDGDTDYELIKDADIIFACGELADKLETERKPFFRFEDFHDVAAVLSRLE